MAKRITLASIPLEIRGGVFFLVGMGVSILMTLFIPWLGVLLLLLTLGLFVLGNMIVVVPAGHAAFVERLGNSYRSLKSKLNFVTPFISIVGMVPTRPENIAGEDKSSCQWLDKETKKTTTIEVTISYTLYCALDDTQVHLLHAKVGENGYLDTLKSRLKSILDEFFSPKDYQTEIYGGKYKLLEPEITKAFEANINSFTKGVTGSDKSLFRYLNVQISGAVAPPEIMEELKTQANEVIKKKTAETIMARKIVEAKGDAEVTDIKTKADAGYTLGILEAQAEGLRKKGLAETEVLEKRGKVLRDNPSIIRERQAEHTPKVLVNGNGGGVMPTVSVDSFVDHDLINK